MFKHKSLSLVVVNGAVMSLNNNNYVVLYKDIEDTSVNIEYAVFVNNEALSVHTTLADALDTLDYLENEE